MPEMSNVYMKFKTSTSKSALLRVTACSWHSEMQAWCFTSCWRFSIWAVGSIQLYREFYRKRTIWGKRTPLSIAPCFNYISFKMCRSRSLQWLRGEGGVMIRESDLTPEACKWSKTTWPHWASRPYDGAWQDHGTCSNHHGLWERRGTEPFHSSKTLMEYIQSAREWARWGL